MQCAVPSGSSGRVGGLGTGGVGRGRGLGIIHDLVFAPSPPKGSRAPTWRGIPGFPLCLSTHDLVPTILLCVH